MEVVLIDAFLLLIWALEFYFLSGQDGWTALHKAIIGKKQAIILVLLHTASTEHRAFE